MRTRWGRLWRRGFAEGTVKREDLFIQAKLWNTNHRPEHVRPDLMQTLKDLQVEYLDSFVIHWPQAAPSTGKAPTTRLDGAFPAPEEKNSMFPINQEGYFSCDMESHYVETWHAMEKLVDEGLVRSIGLSNFNKTQIQEVVAAVKKHPVSTLQNECHPYLQQKDLIDFCNANKICFQAFSPLGSGDTHLAVASSPTGVIPLQDPHVKTLAEKYGKSSAQMMLKWQIQRGVSIVAKSVNPERIRSNGELFGWEISAEDMTSFDKLNVGWRHLLWPEVAAHPDYPFKDELPHGFKPVKAALVSSSGTAA
mmetsp:Transcript_55248/g.126996  ORF Transcript_55248/g.126996 Transcript_55248/m.126996 type:complete len:307 (+) Transcript_55248:220-1140(+)